MDVVGGGNSSISVLKLPCTLPRGPGREARLETGHGKNQVGTGWLQVVAVVCSDR